MFNINENINKQHDVDLGAHKKRKWKIGIFNAENPFLEDVFAEILF